MSGQNIFERLRQPGCGALALHFAPRVRTMEFIKEFIQEIIDILPRLADGFGPTLSVFFLTLLFSLPLGLVVALARRSRFRVLRWVTKLYISIMRGTPLMLQLLAVLFIPTYLFKLSLGPNYRFTAVIIGFVINYAAYFAEIYRGGIEAVPGGQYEAASVLGFGKVKTFVSIVMPQVIKNILPSVTNEIITLVKDTSLAFAISYVEMFTTAKIIASQTGSLTPLFAAGLFYYVTNLIVAFVMERVEKRLDYYSV